MLRLRLTQSLLRQATRLKLFEHEQAGVYAREVRKASFNASRYGAPKKCMHFLGKSRSDGVSERRHILGHKNAAANDT